MSWSVPLIKVNVCNKLKLYMASYMANTYSRANIIYSKTIFKQSFFINVIFLG